MCCFYRDSIYIVHKTYYTFWLFAGEPISLPRLCFFTLQKRMSWVLLTVDAPMDITVQIVCVCVPYQCGQVTVHSPCDAISTIKHERSDEVIFATERNKTKKTRWVVSKIFLCSSLFGKDSNFDDFCFQMGLKPPTREEDLAGNFDLVFGIVPAMLCKPAFFCGCHGLLHLIFAN